MLIKKPIRICANQKKPIFRQRTTNHEIMEFIPIGYTRKNHGLKGEIKFHVEDTYFDDFMDADVVLIEVRGKKKPYFIEDIRAGNNTIVKLENVDTPEAAQQLNNCPLFLRLEDISDDNHTEDDFYKFRNTVGYTVFNGDEKIGVIQSLEEFPQQLMAEIEYKERRLLVPLNPAFVKKVDSNQKTILVDLPDGLLDL